MFEMIATGTDRKWPLLRAEEKFLVTMSKN